MLDTNNVRVGVTGEMSVGPLGTTAPTGAAGALPVAMKGLGYVDDAGVTEDPNKSVKDIKGWQKGAIVRSLVTDGKLTYKLRLIETKKETVEAFYGTEVAVSATEGTWVINPTSTGGRQCFDLDVIDGANIRRIWIPQGEITDTAAIKYANTDEYGYEITITAYYDADLGGNAQVWDTALRSAA